MAVRDERVLVVGSGPIGLACAISAKRRGLDPLVVDAGAIVNSIAHYPVQMEFFTTPELLEIAGHPFVCSSHKPAREEAMMYYRGVVRAEGLRVETYTTLRSAKRTPDGIIASVTGLRGNDEIRCEKMVLATGYYDNPRPLNVRGEELPHVRHYFDEAHLGAGLNVAVIGGKNSAVEAALSLYRAGARVTLICRGQNVGESVKYWLRPDIENRIKAGDIAGRMCTQVVEIRQRELIVRDSSGGESAIAADRVYALTGFLPDTELFRRVGIEIEPGTGRPVHDSATHETNVPGVFVAGSICSGFRTSDIFIENGRFDGEKIFATPARA